jgi:pimeloyl-ACP methyl ester carboxylesterase
MSPRSAVIFASGWSGPGIEWRFSPIRSQLRACGFDTHHFKRNGMGWGDIRNSSLDLQDLIIELNWKNSYTKIFIVGHSMGGLIARYSAQVHGGIDGIVTIGTPHYGTLGSLPEKVAFSKSARQMAVGSAFVNNLNSNHELDPPIMTVACNYDILVIPHVSAHLLHSKRLSVNYGHVGVMFSNKVANETVRFFDRIDKSK